MKLLALKNCPYEEWLKGEFWTTFEPDYGRCNMPWAHSLLWTYDRQYNEVFNPRAKLASLLIWLVRDRNKPIPDGILDVAQRPFFPPTSPIYHRQVAESHPETSQLGHAGRGREIAKRAGKIDHRQSWSYSKDESYNQ
jgi:hypothetical protein